MPDAVETYQSPERLAAPTSIVYTPIGVLNGISTADVKAASSLMDAPDAPDVITVAIIRSKTDPGPLVVSRPAAAPCVVLTGTNTRLIISSYDAVRVTATPSGVCIRQFVCRE